MAKEIKFSEDARSKMLKGVDKLANTVKSTIKQIFYIFNSLALHFSCIRKSKIVKYFTYI